MHFWSVFDLDGKESKLTALEREIEKPDFWNDSTAAQQTMKSVSNLREEVESWRAFQRRLHDLIELAQMDDQSLRADLEKEVSVLEADLDK